MTTVTLLGAPPCAAPSTTATVFMVCGLQGPVRRHWSGRLRSGKTEEQEAAHGAADIYAGGGETA